MNLENYKLTSHCTKRLADMTTPVGIYLRLRQEFKDCFLLESADYRGSENSWSFICADPIAEISVKDGVVRTRYPDGKQGEAHLANHEVLSKLKEFTSSFSIEPADGAPAFLYSFFGYLSFDSIPYFEDIKFTAKIDPHTDIPEINYRLFRYVIAINHFNDQLFTLTINPDSRPLLDLSSSIEIPSEPFRCGADEDSTTSDQEFIETIKLCKRHIERGDIFQIVPSRRFSRSYSGDDFKLYRALRSINPSPYLFYFDYGDYKIFGSSPEGQLVINNGKASTFPIAGTYKRSGDDAADQRAVEQLLNDPKENAEHVMLVDLGRNDLSKNCENVRVDSFKEVQFYSHLIHLVSKISGDIMPDCHPLKLLGDTFPAGTLSGAPKYMALKLIDRFEPVRRSFYGGAIGVLGLNGNINHAITIRSFLAKAGRLTFQAGAGVVLDSLPENELKEVENKLSALRRALQLAEEV